MARKASALPMDEASRMARAKELGFALEGYHGTGADIRAFDPNKLGSLTNAGSAKRGFFFADDAETPNHYARIGSATPTSIKDMPAEIAQAIAPLWNKAKDANVAASAYANQARAEFKDAALAEFRQGKIRAPEIEDRVEQLFADWAASSSADAYRAAQQTANKANSAVSNMWQQARRGDAAVYPVKLRMENPYTVDLGGAPRQLGDFTEILDKALAAGHDGARILNTFDGGPKTNISVVFDPTNIRSRFAAFDPAKRNSTDLLASYGPNPLSAALYGQPQE
jgi:hypothetical protein